MNQENNIKWIKRAKAIKRGNKINKEVKEKWCKSRWEKKIGNKK